MPIICCCNRYAPLSTVYIRGKMDPTSVGLQILWHGHLLFRLAFQIAVSIILDYTGSF